MIFQVLRTQNYVCRFPSQKRSRSTWLESISRSGWEPTSRSVICSQHFKPEDYEPYTPFRCRRRLKPSAVPSVFTGCQTVPQPKAKKRKLETGHTDEVGVNNQDEALEPTESKCEKERQQVQQVQQEHDEARQEGRMQDEEDKSNGTMHSSAKNHPLHLHDHDYEEMDPFRLKNLPRRSWSSAISALRPNNRIHQVMCAENLPF